jgi:hypothetical protein
MTAMTKEVAQSRILDKGNQWMIYGLLETAISDFAIDDSLSEEDVDQQILWFHNLIQYTAAVERHINPHSPLTHTWASKIIAILGPDYLD